MADDDIEAAADRLAEVTETTVPATLTVSLQVGSHRPHQVASGIIRIPLRLVARIVDDAKGLPVGTIHYETDERAMWTQVVEGLTEILAQAREAGL